MIDVMRNALSFVVALVLASMPVVLHAQAKELGYRFDGGMLLHTGYLSGNIEPLGYKASGMPFGLGGVLRYHFDNHWRLGAEGYVSTLKQMGNGSYLKYGWGGVVGDYHLTLGRFLPYAGLTVGGGSNTDFLMMEAPQGEWEPAGETYYRKKSFFFIDPFIGVDYILTRAIHLTVKVDYLAPMGQNLNMPLGPRFYFGILFYH